MSLNADESALGSVSSFSSLELDDADLQKKYLNEKEKNRKLEEKLSGYKTVVQQIPKYEENIKELKRRNKDQQDKLNVYEKLLRENNAQEESPKSPLQDAQGITELGEPHSPGRSGTTTRSPSFVILSCQKTESDPLSKKIPDSSRQATLSSSNPTSPPPLVYPTTPLSTTHEPVYIQGKPLQTNQNYGHKNISQAVVRSPFPQLNREPVQMSFSEVPPSTQSHNYKASASVDPSRLFNWEGVGNSASPFVSSQGSSTFASQPENSQRKDVPTLCYPHPSTRSFLPVESYGIGARPKEWQPLMTHVPKQPTRYEDSLLRTEEKVYPPHTNQHFQVPEPNKPGSVVGGAPAERSSTLNNLSGDSKNFLGMAESQKDLLNMSGPTTDLMKFGSFTFQQNIPTPANVSSQDKSVTFPSDDQSQLAAQAESMASMVKSSDSVSGISEQLAMFAKEFEKMAKKLRENEVLIQRQQVQIQSLSKTGNETALRAEVQSLREENEMLHAFLTAERQGHGSHILEPGWAVVANQASEANLPADHPVMKKLDTLEKINAKLFMANKDWHSKWEILRRQNQERNDELEATIQKVTQEKQKLQEDFENLEKQLQDAMAYKQESGQKIFDLESEKKQLERFVESLKSDVQLLTNDKRKLFADLNSLKNTSKTKAQEEKGLDTEIGLLKQQLTLFAEDFEKERQDRATAENKLEKYRKEKDHIKQSLENKLKKLNSQLKTLEGEVRMKSRQNVELQYQVDDLKLQLQSEQRKAALAAQQPLSYHPPTSTYHGPSTHLFYTSGGERYNSEPSQISRTVRPTSPSTSRPVVPARQLSPEHLAGAWKCKDCTYINYPNRTVCDICGYINAGNGELASNFETGGQELHSRGDRLHAGFDVEDVVADCGEPNTPLEK
ncbi:uncharacterized protein LOC131950531 isoform X2 [Physella acuta]|uniref:uncharacterized protein LOC131950531 isoform X2 n=1 Tax=Physella acuta TaxID=109671 RepID=UPI0027DAD2D7|nr:uncharacterized protein LOC131950531 isoform X2 [Physella acuta]